MMETKFAKVPIYPMAQYIGPWEKRGIPAPLKPTVFEYDGATVTVDKVLACERGVSLKVGGRGFWFKCRVSWMPSGVQRTKESIIWYDDFYDEWFLEVPERRAPQNRAGSLMPDISITGPGAQPVSAAIMFSEKYVREPIFPLVRYLRPEEKKCIPSNKVPFAYEYDGATIVVKQMMVCELALARKTKEPSDGCRYVCIIENQQEPQRRLLQTVLWFNIDTDAWFYEVPESAVAKDWDVEAEDLFLG